MKSFISMSQQQTIDPDPTFNIITFRKPFNLLSSSLEGQKQSLDSKSQPLHVVLFEDDE